MPIARPRATSASTELSGVIPGPLWVVLLFSSLTIFVFMMFFADSRERWYVQALMPAAVVAVMSATLFLITSSTIRSATASAG